MDIQKIISVSNLKSLAERLKQFDYSKLLNRSKKLDQILVVDISDKLTLLNIEVKPKIRALAIDAIDLPEQDKDQTIVGALTRFIQKYQVQHTNAILKPSLDSSIIKRIQLPSVPEVELPETIKWKIKEDLPFELSEAAIGYSLIKRATKDDGSKALDIMCAAARQERIRSQVLLIKQAGLKCLSVGLLPFSYAALSDQLGGGKEESIGIIDLGQQTASISICKGRRLEFYRELPLSVDKLKESLKGVLVSAEGRIQLSDQEAEAAIFEIGVPQAESSFRGKTSSSQILSMLRPNLERLGVEIKRSIAYFVSEYGGDQVIKVFLAGLSVKIPNIDTFLSEETNLICKKVALDGLEISSGDVDSQKIREHLGCLGLVIDYGHAVNLLPFEFRAEKFEKIQKLSLRWVAFILFLILFVSYLFAKIGMGAYQRRLNNAKLHLNVLSEIKETKEKIDELDNFISDIRSQEVLISGILKSLSHIASHRGFFILDLWLNADSKKGEMSGFVKSTSENPDTVVADFIRRAEETHYFSDVDLVSVKKSKHDGFDVTEFDISFVLE